MADGGSPEAWAVVQHLAGLSLTEKLCELDDLKRERPHALARCNLLAAEAFFESDFAGARPDLMEELARRCKDLLGHLEREDPGSIRAASDELVEFLIQLSAALDAG